MSCPLDTQACLPVPVPMPVPTLVPANVDSLELQGVVVQLPAEENCQKIPPDEAT